MVSAVIVSYRSSGVIAPCLRALAAADEIIVVDNLAGDTDLAHLLRRDFPQVRLIVNDRNEGFGRGANTGFLAAQHDWLLLMNPDAVLAPGALDALFAAAGRNPESGLLAPILRNPAGEIEPSHDGELIAKRRLPRKRSDPTPDGDICVEFLSGAVLLIPRKVLEQTGGFDPGIFLFFEDDDFCRRVREAGYSLILVRDAEAAHIGGASSGSGFNPRIAWRKNWHFGWSRLHYEMKHQGRTAAWAEGLPMILRHAGKALLYAISIQREKAIRDAARAMGMAARLMGLKAI